MIRTGTRILHSVLMVGLVANISSCRVTEDPETSEPALTNGVDDTAVEQQTVPPPMNLKRQIEISKKDLADRLNVPPESVALSGARQVTWRSGALGCPKPGMNYTEALVPGAVIYLQVDNVIHAYHARIGGEPFYCPRERVEQPVLGEGEDLT